MAEDFQQKWEQMHRSIKGDDELTKVRIPVSTNCSVTICILQASSRDEHPAWFADLATNAHTKEEFMNKNCQAGIIHRSMLVIDKPPLNKSHLERQSSNASLKDDVFTTIQPKTQSENTTGPSKRLFGKGRDSTERGKVERKAAAASPTDGLFFQASST